MLEADANRCLKDLLVGKLAAWDFGSECFMCCKMKHANLAVYNKVTSDWRWDGAISDQKKAKITCASELIVSFCFLV